MGYTEGVEEPDLSRLKIYLSFIIFHFSFPFVRVDSCDFVDPFLAAEERSTKSHELTRTQRAAHSNEMENEKWKMTNEK
jgi:hypothetical protein